MIRVYLACSLDGFIAGPDDDLAWLDPGEAPPTDTSALTFEAFLGEMGAMVMGRRTYDVVTAMGHPWPYGELPVLVATHRPLEGAPPTVRAAAGDIDALLDQALALSGGRDVYLDGGNLVRQGLEADRVDELVITWMPILLAGGVSLFDGLTQRRTLRFGEVHPYGSMRQVRAEVLRDPS